MWQCLAALGSCRLVLALFLRSINAFDMFKESLGGLIKYLYDKMGARLGEGMEKVWWVEVLGMGSTVDVNLCSEKKGDECLTVYIPVHDKRYILIKAMNIYI